MKGFEDEFAPLDALHNPVLAFNASGQIVFTNRRMKILLRHTQQIDSIFDLLQDHRLSQSLQDHIQQTHKASYFFTVVVQQTLVYFQVTRYKDFFLCNGQSEHDIEQNYQLQISSRRKMLEIKSQLLALCMMDKSDFDTALQTILQTCGTILECERVSFWWVNESQTEINCEKLYLQSLQDISENVAVSKLSNEQAKAYFEYINKEHAFILADDIATHPATKEFYESYSKPQNICSLLDVPVWHNGVLYSILCAEQVGIPKKWQLEDVQFMLSLSDSLSLCLQTRDRLNTEMLLRETNHKLLRSNTDLEHFATVAAHDIKSPLRGIVNFLTLLKKQYGNTLDEPAQEYINYTLKNAGQLTQLINELLAYAKLEQQMAEPALVDVSQLIREIEKEQQDFITERKGKVVVSGSLPRINVQRNLMYQLFSNIIHNAIKFTHTDSPPVLEINYQHENGYIKFEFADNGIGIDDQYAEQIFSLFARINTLEQFDGTGIGLATCRKIADMLGGKIIYQRRTKPDGSIFTVCLPSQLLCVN